MSADPARAPAIIHTHTATAGIIGRAAGVVTNVLGFFTGRPRARLVHTFHGHVFHGYFSPFRSRVLVMVERILAPFTDRIITVSEAVKRDLVERYRVCPAARVTVVPARARHGMGDASRRERG